MQKLKSLKGGYLWVEKDMVQFFPKEGYKVKVAKTETNFGAGLDVYFNKKNKR